MSIIGPIICTIQLQSHDFLRHRNTPNLVDNMEMWRLSFQKWKYKHTKSVHINLLSYVAFSCIFQAHTYFQSKKIQYNYSFQNYHHFTCNWSLGIDMESEKSISSATLFSSNIMVDGLIFLWITGLKNELMEISICISYAHCNA